MSRKVLFNSIKYIVSLSIGFVLLWAVLTNGGKIPLETVLGNLWEDISNAKLIYIFYSFLLFIFSNFLRGYRWNLILSSLGYKLNHSKTFLAVMSMYFANLIVPRLGEVTRCGILQKTQDVPVSTSLGSVVAERLLDVLSLFLLIFLALVLEFDRLGGFFRDFFTEKLGSLSQNIGLLIVLGVIVLGLLLVVYLFFRNNKEKITTHSLFIKIKNFIKELAAGFTSILKVRNPFGFWGSTIFIWVAYYLMSFLVFFAMPATENLGISAGLSVLIMGGLGMSAPVQGGFGTFHLLVSSILVLYGIPIEEGKSYATLLHSSQVLFILFFGGISMIIALVMGKKKMQNDRTNN